MRCVRLMTHWTCHFYLFSFDAVRLTSPPLNSSGGEAFEIVETTLRQVKPRGQGSLRLLSDRYMEVICVPDLIFASHKIPY